MLRWATRGALLGVTLVLALVALDYASRNRPTAAGRREPVFRAPVVWSDLTTFATTLLLPAALIGGVTGAAVRWTVGWRGRPFR